MAWNANALNLAANTLRSAATYAQLHSAAAGDGTANVTTAARQPVTWSSPSSGSFDIASQITFTGGASNGTVYSCTLWSAGSGGTMYGEFVLTGDITFNSNGEYIVTSLPATGSST